MLVIILIIFIIYTLILRKILLKNKLQCIYYREIPSNDAPAYVGKIIKGHVDGNDIVSTILDLNYRKYIKITTEKINGKNKQVLYFQRRDEIFELKEHELFLIKQIFKDSNKVIFEDYIKSSKFNQNFKAFDKMLERSIERNRIYKTSLSKNINKIVLLSSFLIFGIVIFYSILSPIILSISSLMSFTIKTNIIFSLVISSVIYIFIAYKYISYINKTTNAQENINLNITYIILCVILCLIITFYDFDKLLSIFSLELIWYKIIVNFILSIITLLYMFNIINHTDKEDYLYYFFVVVSIIAIVINLKIVMAISIIFFATYTFFKSPKHINLKEEDYIYKWMSFKKYLDHYSLLSDKEENAIGIWDKYLIYAVSLGINKKIIKKYGKLNNILLLNETYLNRFYTEYLE